MTMTIELYTNTISRYFAFLFKEGPKDINNILTRMVQDSQVLDNELKNAFPILTIASEVSRTICMNEIEIAYWSLFLDKIKWSFKVNPIENLDNVLWASALIAKSCLNDGKAFQVVKDHINMEKPIIVKIANEMKNILDKSLFNLSMNELNKRFNLLSKVSFT